MINQSDLEELKIKLIKRTLIITIHSPEYSRSRSTLVEFCIVLKNLTILPYSKLNSKSYDNPTCDYLFKVAEILEASLVIGAGTREAHLLVKPNAKLNRWEDVWTEREVKMAGYWPSFFFFARRSQDP